MRLNRSDASMQLLIDAWTFILQNPVRFGQSLFTHIVLSLSALTTACAIAIPLGIVLADRQRGALAAINLANVGRTLPSLAVLALVMPILGTGFVPSWFALTLLALPPILINTYTAVRLLADAIERAKSTDRAAITAALESSAFSDHFMPYGPTKFVNGQNTGAQPLMTQVIKGDIRVIVPRDYREIDPIFPLRA